MDGIGAAVRCAVRIHAVKHCTRGAVKHCARYVRELLNATILQMRLQRFVAARTCRACSDSYVQIRPADGSSRRRIVLDVRGTDEFGPPRGRQASALRTSLPHFRREPVRPPRGPSRPRHGPGRPKCGPTAHGRPRPLCGLATVRLTREVRSRNDHGAVIRPVNNSVQGTGYSQPISPLKA
jgi:hypothetical protein